MRRYRDAWLTVSAVVLMCGGYVAIAEFTIATVLVIFFSAGVLVACTVLALHDDKHSRCGPRRLMAQAVLVGLAAVAACGMFVLLGAAAWLLILLPVVASPWTVRHAVRVCRRGTLEYGPAGDKLASKPGLAVIAEPSPVVSPPPAALDLEELCWAWRRSYVRLQRCRTVAQTARVVAERQQCLDELERRNPGGLSAWLKAGARAAGDPSPYLRPAGPTDVRDNAA